MAEPVYCSFCGRNQHEVALLVTAPDVRICDECIEIAAGIVAERSTPESRAWKKTWQIVPYRAPEVRRAR